ncbi:hypothetical protein ARMSODRAFT_469642 [Armillaria solidipes]|uniref:Uncharacterized protein n=1 Tax=Armillaria solidipes TaxID=1076256 RepID=A0A2H3BB84_9AGAR|nr:hypothetical protein ARMSODRAFT_469642 [Armillaria solidipes]
MKKGDQTRCRLPSARDLTRRPNRANARKLRSSPLRFLPPPSPPLRQRHGVFLLRKVPFSFISVVIGDRHRRSTPESRFLQSCPSRQYWTSSYSSSGLLSARGRGNREQ